MNPASAAYVLFVALAAIVAACERAVALRHEKRLLADGGRDVAPAVLRVMAPTYVLVFVAAVAEHLVAVRRPAWPVVAAATAVFVAAKALKFWAARTLGPLWTMKVVLPRQPSIVTGGPYRYVRHPNYVAVMAEIVALPAAGGAWWTAAIGGGLFAIILAFRIRSEERALSERPGYVEAMGAKGRFVPGGRRP